MTPHDRTNFDPRIADWLEDDPNTAPDQALDVVLAAFPSIKQRHGSRLPWRFTMTAFPRLAIGAAAIVVVVLAGAFLLRPPASGVGGGVPTPAPSSSASTAPSPSSSASPSTSVFTSAAFKIPIAFTMSDGWSLQANKSGVVGLGLGDAAAFIVSIDATTVRGATPSAPWVPWPADIHAWLAGRPELKTGATRTGVVGGHPAVIVDAEYVRDKITDPGDWLKYGTGSSDGMNWSGSWPGSLHVVVVKTGPTSGIVVAMDAPTDAFSGASASLDKMLTGLTFR